MTSQERLKEIEEYIIKYGKSGDDEIAHWLISRVKRLTEALGKLESEISSFRYLLTHKEMSETTNGTINFLAIQIQEARKALEGECQND